MADAITVREYQNSDVDEVVSAVHESLQDLLPWMPWCSAAYSAADAAAWVRTTREGRMAGAIYDFAIVDQSGRYSGGCGINQVNQANRFAISVTGSVHRQQVAA